VVSLTTGGALVGAVLGGALSDRFGRKLVVFGKGFIGNKHWTDVESNRQTEPARRYEH